MTFIVQALVGTFVFGVIFSAILSTIQKSKRNKGFTFWQFFITTLVAMTLAYGIMVVLMLRNFLASNNFM